MKVISRLAWLVVLSLTVANCSSKESAPSAPTPQAAAPMASQTPANPPMNVPAPVNGPSVLADPDARIFGVTEADAVAGRGPCEFNPSTGQFVCPDQSRDGITFTMRFTLYDASGHAQQKFDRTTAVIKNETTADGTTTRNGHNVTIHRSGTMTTTGLGPDAKTHTLNGTEQGTVVATITQNDGSTITTTTTINDATVNLVVPVKMVDRTTAYPLSGSRVHTTVTTGPAGRGSLTLRRQETFDGTSIVRVEITANGVTQQCTFDLASKTSTCQRNP